MSLFAQIPVYAPMLANVIKMASRADQENAPAHRPVRSKIPVSTFNVGLRKNFEKTRDMDRRPLGDIQTSTAGGVTHERKRPKISSAVIETIVTQISPKGSVFAKCKTKTILHKRESHQQFLQAIDDRAKYVTIRKKEESPLDWNFEQLRSGLKEPTATPKQAALAAGNPRRSKSADREVVSDYVKPLTPTQLLVAQHNRVKNIKRSLKRPSSRELQTKPACEEVRTEAMPLLPKEIALKIKCELGSMDIPLCTRELTLSYERYIVKYLLQSGEELRGKPGLCSIQRAIVVNWLVKVNSVQGPDSGSPQVLQIAVRHLDRVLSLGAVPIERVQLLAAACYWLAQKQCAKPRSASCFTRHAADAFFAVDLRSAEKYVLRRLNFPTIPVVADDFVPYLVLVCSPRNPELLSTGATFLCTAALLDMELSSCSPDVIALAAVITCILLLRDGKIEYLHLCPIYRSTGSNPHLRAVRSRMLRTVLAMREQRCPYREAYVQYERPPLYVAITLADRACNSE